MIIPPDRLASDTLQALLEEFITREGTDYGDREWSLDEKVKQLKSHVASGDVVILFDPDSQTTTLVRKETIVQ